MIITPAQIDQWLLADKEDEHLGIWESRAYYPIRKQMLNTCYSHITCCQSGTSNLQTNVTEGKVQLE